ncbi:Crp/Fnr family transcriptional regulator [Methylobacterium sp. P1-11]|uniref:Crp/Fnr family transcriptional regulator n=1 Tax=Methylobacterium sp. P1-11 TaxID=2024616 RepID=UPI0011EE061D|nr:Crp/Fnr family transcriptional regulator [Methylobacterium sp. P1-11]KAA0116682.1 Crp/Fnr family transcriptional regulator [Methylobacterium sp. P1-11]
MNQSPQRMRAAAGVLFSDLDREAADALLDAATHRQIAEGMALFHQGDVPSQLFQVVTGLVKLSRVGTNGEQTTLRFMGPGELVGCVAIFQQFPFPATAIASKPCSLLCWSAAQILELIHRYPAVASNALKSVGGRAQEMIERVTDLSAKGVEARLAGVLLRLASQVGRTSPKGVEIRHPVTRNDMAEMTGVTYFTVSRVLSAWQKQEIVRLGRERVIVVEPHRLAQIAG